VLGKEIPVVYYVTKIENELKEMKDESKGYGDNIFLIQSGTSYYFDDGALERIPIGDNVEIDINQNNTTRSIHVLTPKLKKSWYQIVLFAFGPVSFDKKYIIFLRNDGEIVRGTIRENYVFLKH